MQSPPRVTAFRVRWQTLAIGSAKPWAVIPRTRSRPIACRDDSCQRDFTRGSGYQRKAELLACAEISVGHGARQGAHAQDITLALGHRQGATRIQQVEGM